MKTQILPSTPCLPVFNQTLTRPLPVPRWALMCWLSMWLCSVILPAAGEFAVDPGGDPQYRPDIEGSTVVWQEYVSFYGDYDILGIDLEAAAGTLYIAGWDYDQTNPRIDRGVVVWQDDYYGDGTDWDVHAADVTNPDAITPFPVSTIPDISETRPDIHGRLVAFQQQYIDPGTAVADWDIYAADITEPNEPRTYPVMLWENDQTHPAVYRSEVVFSDYFVWPDTGEAGWDITLADTWLKNDPVFRYPAFDVEDETAPAIDRDYIVYQVDYSVDGTDYDIIAVDRSDPRVYKIIPVAQSTHSERSPAVSGHIVVWQDNRHGNWDIYGYNLITRKEFQITDNPADQTNPAISGDTVVWEDTRSGVATIYAAYLDPVDIADNPVPLFGDIDNNGRVDLYDFMTLAENWLNCSLQPAEACSI